MKTIAIILCLAAVVQAGTIPDEFPRSFDLSLSDGSIVFSGRGVWDYGADSWRSTTSYGVGSLVVSGSDVAGVVVGPSGAASVVVVPGAAWDGAAVGGDLVGYVPSYDFGHMTDLHRFCTTTCMGFAWAFFFQAVNEIIGQLTGAIKSGQREALGSV